MNADTPLSSAKQFVDTNILVYAHDLSAGKKHTQAATLLQNLWGSREGCLSIQVLQEFYSVITRKVGKPLNSSQASEVIQDLAQWKVHSPKPRDILLAIQIQQRYQISFWDALVVCSALRLRCQVIWSEDLNSGQVYEGVKVQNPFIEVDSPL